MLNRTFVNIAAAAGVFLATSSFVFAQDATTTETPEGAAMTTTPLTATTTDYASVNGIELYYEIYGEGEPLIVLHGGLGSTSMFAPLLPGLTETRQVIAVDLQAHGRTADVDRPISYEAMADDIAGLIEELGFEQVDIMGYSMGGGVALQAAIRHPELVRKLVLVSTVFSRDGWYPEIQAGMAAMTAEAASQMLETPMYAEYSTLAPRVEDWPVLIGKMGEMMSQDYNWSEQVAALKIPVMIVVGDADSVRLPHAVEMFGLLGGGKGDGGFSGVSNSNLVVLPGALHWGILMHSQLLPNVLPFLNAPLPEVN